LKCLSLAEVRRLFFGSNEIMKFSQKLDNKGLKSGIFVAMNGITGRNLEVAKGTTQTSITKRY
jgi:hypothetical protein